MVFNHDHQMKEMHSSTCSGQVAKIAQSLLFFRAANISIKPSTLLQTHDQIKISKSFSNIIIYGIILYIHACIMYGNTRPLCISEALA